MITSVLYHSNTTYTSSATLARKDHETKHFAISNLENKLTLNYSLMLLLGKMTVIINDSDVILESAHMAIAFS